MEMASFLSPSSLVFSSRNGQQLIWDFQGGPRTPANPRPLSVAVSVPVPPAPRSVSVELQHSRKSSSTKFSEFRPCIDIHKGKVKQIVGSSLSDLVGEAGDLITNFESEKSAAEFAELYKRDNLYGGHVIMLGADTNSQAAALDALSAYPGGLQLGGGVNPKNARVYLDAGASHVIVTSYIFKDGEICFEKLGELVHEVGKSRLVLDLSCRKRDGHYVVVTDRWQKFSDLIISEESLANLASYAAEFLVHGVDVEGKRLGIDKELVQLLGQWSPIPVTYAGGASTLSDLELIEEAGGGRVDVTVGSALDIFGGALPYKDVVAWHNHHVNSSS